MKLDQLTQPIFERVRPALLFHGTPFLELVNILSDDALYEGIHWGRQGEPHGPRFTRDYRRAWSFTDISEWVVGGVIAVDRQKVLTRFRVVPYQDVDMHGDQWNSPEHEEVILTQVLQPLSRYMEFFVCPDERFKEALTLPGLLDDAVAEEKFQSVEQAQKRIEYAFQHPKRLKQWNPLR